MFAHQSVKQLPTTVYSRYVPSQILNYYDPLTRAQRRGHQIEWYYLSLRFFLCAVQVDLQLASIARGAQKRQINFFDTTTLFRLSIKYVFRGLVFLQREGLRPLFAHTSLFVCAKIGCETSQTNGDQPPVQGAINR